MSIEGRGRLTVWIEGLIQYRRLVFSVVFLLVAVTAVPLT